jgi:hypothetical protein
MAAPHFRSTIVFNRNKRGVRIKPAKTVPRRKKMQQLSDKMRQIAAKCGELRRFMQNTANCGKLAIIFGTAKHCPVMYHCNTVHNLKYLFYFKGYHC